MKKVFAAKITVEWGYESHALVLTPRNWARIVAGKPLAIRGKGYRYEGEFFWDYWEFDGGRDGALLVTYGKDGGTGFGGKLSDALIEEFEPELNK